MPHQIRDEARYATALSDPAATTELAPPAGVPTFVVDGAYDFSAAELEESAWDDGGAAPGSSFASKFGEEAVALAERHGLDTSRRPRMESGAEVAARLLGYRPAYSLRDALGELERWGAAGPPLHQPRL